MTRSLRGLAGFAVMALVAGLLVSTTTSPASAGGSISYVYSHSQQSFEAVPNGGGGGDVSHTNMRTAMSASA